MGKSKVNILEPYSGVVGSVIFQKNGVIRIRPRKYSKSKKTKK